MNDSLISAHYLASLKTTTAAKSICPICLIQVTLRSCHPPLDRILLSLCPILSRLCVRHVWTHQITFRCHSLCLCSLLPGMTGHKKHTHSSEHTHCEHTPGAVGSHLCCGAWGAVGGSMLAQKGTSVVVLKEERALYIHSPHLQFLPARDSNSQPLDYESDSLTIRLRLPPIYI